MFQVWWAYYQCEPFGSHWEQTANITAMIHGVTSMIAATRGTKLDALSVVDMLPSDSMTWKKRTRFNGRGVSHPVAQTQILKKSFGFS